MEILVTKNMTQKSGTKTTNSPYLITKKCRQIILQSETLKTFHKKQCKTAFWYYFGIPKTAGFCGIASYFVYKVLKRNKFKPKIIWGDFVDKNGEPQPHCWVQLGRTIIDITADQFGYKPIVFDIQNQRYQPSCEMTQKAFKDRYWPLWQRPTKKKINDLSRNYW